jgi:ATP-dependent RNA helicase DeaD
LLVPHPRRRLAERLIGAAKVAATWGPAPSADAVRARDAERLAEQARSVLAEEASEDDLALAQRLLAGSDITSDALAAALIKMLRAPLPAPEEIAEQKPERREARREGAAEAPRGASGIWFSMDVGRDGNADPRWLLPFLCRRGHVTRQEIGRIRILGQETQFEVASYAAERFAAAARQATGENAEITIRPMQPLKPGHASARHAKPAPAAAAPRAVENAAPAKAPWFKKPGPPSDKSPRRSAAEGKAAPRKAESRIPPRDKKAPGKWQAKSPRKPRK